MKKSHCFETTPIYSPFTGTYKKFDNPKRSKAYKVKAEYGYSTLDPNLSKKHSHKGNLNCFIKTITQFFSLKEEVYSSGSKICTNEFTFINPEKI